MISGESDKGHQDGLPNGELATSGHILSGIDGNCFALQLVGDVRLIWSVALERYCESVFTHQPVERFFVDLNRSTNLDSTTLGVLAKLAMLCKKKLGFAAELSFGNADIERLVRSMGFASVFNILELSAEIPVNPAVLNKLCSTDCTEEEVKRSVLEAHKALSGLSEENYNKFKDLISTLEKDS